jgi:hypothetical protein
VAVVFSWDRLPACRNVLSTGFNPTCLIVLVQRFVCQANAVILANRMAQESDDKSQHAKALLQMKRVA